MEKARKKEITIEAIHWDYRKAKNNTYPVKLRVTVGGKVSYYPIQLKGKNISISKEQWKAIRTTDVRGESLKIKDQVDAYRLQAIGVKEDITKGGRPFSISIFEKKFFANEKPGGFMTTFKNYLDKVLSEDRIGTYRTYKSAYNTFSAYLKNRDISAYEITPELLGGFERYLSSPRKATRATNGIYAAATSQKSLSTTTRKAGRTTIGIYARTLRVIYNLCADDDQTLKEFYPFGNSKRGKYKILDSKKGAKKGDAFSADQLRQFINTTPDKDSPHHEAKMYWLFSFYCQGMNFKDICYLTYGDIQGDVIRYTRQKTKRTEENELIEVSLSDVIREIIISLGSPDKKSGSYVFPILDKFETDMVKVENTAQQKMKLTNKWLKSLCRDNKLPEITTYWSRHTYASLLKGSGVPVEMIRELLGHSDLKTTEHYLKRFDIEQKKAVNNALLELVKSKNIA